MAVLATGAVFLVLSSVLASSVEMVEALKWLRKAILRASGHVALHDEEAIYQRELAASHSLVGMAQ